MTVPLRECGAASRALSAVLLWSRNRDRAQAGPGPMPLDVVSALRAVCKRVRRIQDLLPDEKLLTTGWGEDKVPVTEELLAVQAQLRQLAAKQVALEDKCRVQAWRESMDEAWKDKRREVYRWVKGKEDPSLVMLAREDGTLTANLGEMDALVKEAWGANNAQVCGQGGAGRGLVHGAVWEARSVHAHGGVGPQGG